MYIYVINRLDEENMEVPEAEAIRAYTSMEAAKEGLARYLVGVASNFKDFENSLRNDQNHEEFPKDCAIGSEKVMDYLMSEISGGYYIYDSSENLINFTIDHIELEEK